MKIQTSSNRDIMTQGLYIMALFLFIWAAVAQLGLGKAFKAGKPKQTLEEKLSDMIITQLDQTGTRSLDYDVTAALDTIIREVCKTNDLDSTKYKVHVYNNPEVNAFALPDGDIVVYMGLIKNVIKQNELVGVLCHEMAHIEKGHIMSKLVKELGLSLLIGLTTGNGNVGSVQQLAKLVSSTAFDRSLEQEADMVAVDYMINAQVSPEGLANFLYLLDNGDQEYASWISTHPGGRDRANDILDKYKDNMIEEKSILTSQFWTFLKMKYAE